MIQRRYPEEIRFETKGGVEQITRAYREGFAAQKLGNRWGFIDETGHLAIKRQFDYCHDFWNGFAAVKIGSKWTFIDTSGTSIGDPIFDDVKSFDGGFAEVKIGNQWRLFSRNGELGQIVSTVPEGSQASEPLNAAFTQLIVPPKNPKCRSNGGLGWYRIGYSISFVVIFVGCWIWCIASYGFLFGLGLGWLPSALAAAILSFFWPLILVLVLVAVVIAGWVLAK